MIFANNSQSFTNSMETIPHLVSVGLEDKHPSFMLRSPHKHSNAVEILLVREGSGLHKIEEREYYISVGDILVFDAGTLHSRISSKGISVYSCTATNVQFPNLPSNTIIPPNHSPFLPNIGDFEEFLIINTLMYDNTLRNDRVSSEIANYYLRIFLVKLHQSIRKRGPIAPMPDKNSDVLGKTIKQYIDLHYCEDTLTLTEISEQIHFSPYHISHVFKRIYNLSPMQYVAHRRIGEAQTYLIDTDWTVTDIAMKIGFSNTNQFHHTFSKLVGTTPGKYRKHWTD